MKTVIIFAIVLCAAAIVRSDLADIAEKWKKAVQECKAEEGASDEDVVPLIRRIALETRKTKCLLACANEKMSYSLKNGTTNLDKIAEKISHKYAEATYASVWNEIKAKCSKVKTDDRCELANDLNMCIAVEVFKKGLDPRTYFV